MRLMLEEIRLLEARIGQLECELAELAKASSACQALLTVPGIGLLTSTAMVAVIGDPRSFDSARRYASFLGLTPREHSSGDKRVLSGRAPGFATSRRHTAPPHAWAATGTSPRCRAPCR
jgi:transposase